MNIITKISGDSVSFKAKLNGKTIGRCNTRTRTDTSASYIMKTRAYKSFNNGHFYVSWLGIKDGYQGRYIGTRLLYHALRYYSRKGYRYVTLLNASDRDGQNNSIYNQIGMSYVPNSDGTKSSIMIGNIRHMLHGKFRGLNGVNNRSDRFYRRKVIIPSI